MSLSPDGRTALAIAGEIPKQRLMLYPIGPGEPRSIPLGELRTQSARWLPDGRRVLFSANEPNRGVRLWIQGIDEAKPRALSPEGYRLFANTVSTDGKFVVAEGPDRRPYLFPVEGGEPTPIAGVQTDEVPAGWSADGTLLVRRRGGIRSRTFLVDVRSGRREFWKEFVPQDPAGVSSVGPVWATPDRRWYAYSYFRSLADLYVMEGLR